MTDPFAGISRHMEQIPEEIRPFVAWLRQRPLHNVVEIGVRNGGTASLWCNLASGTVVGVDWTGRDSLGVETIELGKAMESEFPNYRFVCGDSHQYSTVHQVRDHVREVDMLFLDGDHSYDGVKKDLELYRSLVRVGGCVVFHDIVDSAFIREVGHGVYRLWEELEGEKHAFCVGASWGGIGVLVL